MVFNIEYPLVLLLLPVAAVLIYISSKKIIRTGSSRRKTVVCIRMLVFVILILSISGAGIKKVTDKTTTVFVVDSSNSTSNKKDVIADFVSKAIKNRKSSDKVAVVNFGADASVEFTPSDNPVFTSLQTKINKSFTNIEKALEFAASLIPGSDRKRIVLVTDGEQNAGNALEQARILKQQNIALDIYPVDIGRGPEVQLKQINIPKNMRINERFEIEINIDSTIKTKGILKLFKERKLTAEKQIELGKGINRFVFADVADTGGMLTYSAVIEPEDDMIVRNNSMEAFCYIEDKASVLVVQDSDGAAEELVKILGVEVKTKVVKPVNVPVELEQMLEYDAFILSNVSAERLEDRFLNNLKTAVELQGKGLLVTGGDDSYAPGGYYKTQLEEILPVNMNIKSEEELPSLGLILVIDKSGSMSQGQFGVSKVELAKEAAIRSTEVLKKQDSIGIIAFDAAVKWVVNLQKANDLESIKNAIGTVRADGGTQILPPLHEAYMALKDSDTKLKHIILLTDGQAEKAGYRPVIDGLNKANITLSTVAVGQMADAELLKVLAAGGNGRYYMTNEFTDIPRIFTKETFLAGKTYLNNRTFTPVLNGYSKILKGIKAIPSIDGYVGTTSKKAANVIFSSDKNDPVLATWQYGLGRTAAWTSDAKGVWSSRWLEWEQSPRFWKNLISWISQKRIKGDYDVKAELAAGRATLELTMPEDENYVDAQVEAALISPAGIKQDVKLQTLSPGIYGGQFDCDETGVYVANILIKHKDNNTGEHSDESELLSTGISVPYSPEYNIVRKNPAEFFNRMAYESRGRIIDSPKDIFSGKLPPVVSITDITPYLLVMAVILLLADITMRRLRISISGVKAATGKGMKYIYKFTIPLFRKLKISQKSTAIKLKFRKSRKQYYPDRKVKQTGDDIKQPKKEDNNKDKGASISALLDKKRKRERDL